MESNPELVSLQQNIAKVLVKGELAEVPSEENQFYEIFTSKDFVDKVKLPVFKELYEALNTGSDKITGSIWIDTREFPNMNEATAKTLVRFIELFSDKPKDVAKAFETWESYILLEPLIEKLEIKEKCPAFMKLKNYVSRAHPILVLIDVGGSILCRTGERLQAEKRTSATFCQIKKHYHYYRPSFDSFLAELISHPRIQLGFYTSITRKNVMPLLFKIFDLKALNNYRSDIFDVFDQEYNLPDLGPGRKPYSTKRCLQKVLESPKAMEFKFTTDNILLIYSEVIKIIDYPDNAITVKPYEVSDVLNETQD